MSEMILQINHLSKSFGSHEVLRDVHDILDFVDDQQANMV